MATTTAPLSDPFPPPLNVRLPVPITKIVPVQLKLPLATMFPVTSRMPEPPESALTSEEVPVIAITCGVEFPWESGCPKFVMEETFDVITSADPSIDCTTAFSPPTVL